MKRTIKFGLIFCFLIFSISSLYSQDYYTEAISPVSSHGEDLDLTAVLEIFKDSRNLQEFEGRLNENNGVNNLDLNYDGHIDYIRVLEQAKGNYRVIILQAILNENESQDVAVLNIERRSRREIYIQCEGNADIYGTNYYVTPPRYRTNYTYIHVHSWPIWSNIYAPTYRVYHSPWRWSYYPSYWKYRRPVAYSVYYDRPFITTCRGHHYVYTHKRNVRRPYKFYQPHSNYVVKHNQKPRGTYTRTAHRGNTYRKNTRKNNYSNYNNSRTNNNRSNVSRNNSTRNNNRSNVNKNSTYRNNSGNNTRSNVNRSNTNKNTRSNVNRNNSNRSNGNKSTYNKSNSSKNNRSSTRSNSSSSRNKTYNNNRSSNKNNNKSTRSNSNRTNTNKRSKSGRR